MTLTAMTDDRPRLRRAFELLAKRQCRAVRLGKGWHVTGPGVDMLILDLGRLTEADLAYARSIDSTRCR